MWDTVQGALDGQGKSLQLPETKMKKKKWLNFRIKFAIITILFYSYAHCFLPIMKAEIVKVIRYLQIYKHLKFRFWSL